MRVESHSARIHGCETAKGRAVFMDTVSVCAGYGGGVFFYPDWHFVVLAKRDGRLALIALPEAKWKQDLIDEGWTIEREFSSESNEVSSKGGDRG
jgi:hypothetical protein